MREQEDGVRQGEGETLGVWVKERSHWVRRRRECIVRRKKGLETERRRSYGFG